MQKKGGNTCWLLYLLVICDMSCLGLRKFVFFCLSISLRENFCPRLPCKTFPVRLICHSPGRKDYLLFFEKLWKCYIRNSAMVLFYSKFIFHQCPKLEPCSFKMCKDLVLYAKVDNVGRTGQKMWDTKWQLILLGLNKTWRKCSFCKPFCSVQAQLTKTYWVLCGFPSFPFFFFLGHFLSIELNWLQAEARAQESAPTNQQSMCL